MLRSPYVPVFHMGYLVFEVLPSIVLATLLKYCTC